ncbi:putative nucleotidyltransferase with HDIG domain [Lysinibacillus composti]|uniref:HD-GYP domain-containing protein n=2 Tax=Lysinibacillus composti TaxID=720633 RepID=A0A3N9UCV4_9BACI|nr:HD domain-containing phosphohydrolase [Lysinibacillus composti]MBM7609244.1 putative nucleotidyltransferase with HDIG domain [Lysinibacillus composti]RQW74105.1 HD-GYP domain-containing protein [Lysinibacillus composti]
MRLISINILKSGMKIGRTIYNEAGHPLLKADAIVSDRIIERLKQLNIRYVYIDDLISSGIEVEESVPTEKRMKIVNQITDSFHKIKGLNFKDASLVLDKQSKVIGVIVDDLLDSILNSEEILTVLTDAFLYDEYLYQHSFQVTLYSLAIAKELGYSSNDLRNIGIGAMLHDVGKLMVPTSILLKPGRLSDEEYETMKHHTTYGFEILRNLHTISLLVAHCAFQHHERLDGSGYPRGLVDYEIHPYAKVIAVADVFDAVTSNRVYREKMLPSQGICIIDAGSGTLYDAKVVEALKRSVVHYPNGTIVMLSDGRRGVVAKQNIADSSRPIIRIFEENQILLKATYILNLLEVTNLKILKVETEYVIGVE